MRIGIVGGSAAGIYAAMAIKKTNPAHEVTLIEQNSKLGKKLCATGNGKCNLLNTKTNANHFNNPRFVRHILDDFPFEKRVAFLNSFGIELAYEDDLVYPLTFSAPAYVDLLISILNNLGVKIITNEKILGYTWGHEVVLKAKKNEYRFDRVVLACGSKSQPKFGNDGSMLEILAQKGYERIPVKPGLCPIVTEEKTASIKGLRHKAKVSLYQGDKEICKEEGEVLFKKNGLSGIVIFNLASKIARMPSTDYITLHLDLFPESTLDELTKSLRKDASINGSFYLDAFLEPELKEYVLKSLKIKNLNPVSLDETQKIGETLKDLKFTYTASYGFDDSQVSIGGIATTMVDSHLASKSESEIYFIGEMLDIDGVCGGHNLTWALVSALQVAKAIG